jgi:hypothetical protein
MAKIGATAALDVKGCAAPRMARAHEFGIIMPPPPWTQRLQGSPLQKARASRKQGPRTRWDPRPRQIDTTGFANTLGISKWATRWEGPHTGAISPPHARFARARVPPQRNNRHLDGIASATRRSLVSNLDRRHPVLACASLGALASPAVQSTLPPFRMVGRRCRPGPETDRERRARARI